MGRSTFGQSFKGQFTKLFLVLSIFFLQACGKAEEAASKLPGTLLEITDPVSRSSVNHLNFQLRLIANWNSPVSQGLTLQANDVVFNKNKVYLGYNLAGPTQLGAIQVVDVTNQANPTLLSELIISDTKVNGLALA